MSEESSLLTAKPAKRMKLKTDPEYLDDCFRRLFKELHEINVYRHHEMSFKSEFLHWLSRKIIIHGFNLMDFAIKLDKQDKEKIEGKPMTDYFKKQVNE